MIVFVCMCNSWIACIVTFSSIMHSVSSPSLTVDFYLQHLFSGVAGQQPYDTIAMQPTILPSEIKLAARSCDAAGKAVLALQVQLNFIAIDIY